MHAFLTPRKEEQQTEQNLYMHAFLTPRKEEQQTEQNWKLDKKWIKHLQQSQY